MMYRVFNDTIVGSVLLQSWSIMNVVSSFDCLAVHILSDNCMDVRICD